VTIAAQEYSSNSITARRTRIQSPFPHRGQTDTLAGISCQQLLQRTSFMPLNSSFAPRQHGWESEHSTSEVLQHSRAIPDKR
jgi:hypothetical protein